MSSVDPRAVARGALRSAVVWLPLAVVSALVIDEDDPSAWAVPLFVGVLIGLAASGWIASGAAPSSPLVTGALAGLGGYAVVQAIGVARRLVSGDEVRWASFVGAAVLAYGCGLTGAVLGERRRRRRDGDGDSPIERRVGT